MVGVLDNGVQVDYKGLVKNIWINPNEISDNEKDDYRSGFVVIYTG